jgi:hypothetical protein
MGEMRKTGTKRLYTTAMWAMLVIHGKNSTVTNIKDKSPTKKGSTQITSSPLNK